MEDGLKEATIMFIISFIVIIFALGIGGLLCLVPDKYDEYQCLSAAKHLGTVGAYYDGKCAIKGYNITS